MVTPPSATTSSCTSTTRRPRSRRWPPPGCRTARSRRWSRCRSSSSAPSTRSATSAATIPAGADRARSSSGAMAHNPEATAEPRSLDGLRAAALFTGEYDTGPAVVGVHAGAGGTDSQDWAEMLLRMYLRWADARGLKTELLEATPGEEAGLKSATFTLTGDNAYGVMQAEKGVHRLVRLSPFDSAHRRHTSFAQVEASPLVDDDV